MFGRILRLVGARSLQTFGRQIIAATVLWELYERTHNELVISAVGAVQVLPVIALFVPAGALVDTLDRRFLATATAVLTGGVGLGLAIASALGAPVWVYLALLLVQGCANAVHSPASTTLIPLILPREELTRANRIGSSLQELAAVLGPMLAGLALAVVDAAWNYAFVAVTGIAAGVLFATLPRPRPVEAPSAQARKDWRVGLRFIFRSPLLLPALTLDMFAVLFAGVAALLPVIATRILDTGEVGYGMLRAAESVGAVTMAIVAGYLRAWRRPGRVLLTVVALYGAAIVGIGFSRSLPLTLVLLVICGALDNISVVIRLTLEQLVVPDEIRGRVGSVHYVFIGMSNELGGAESGLASKIFGPVAAIVGGGALSIAVVGFVAAKWRALTAMPPLDELTPEHGQPPPTSTASLSAAG